MYGTHYLSKWKQKLFRISKPTIKMLQKSMILPGLTEREGLAFSVGSWLTMKISDLPRKMSKSSRTTSLQMNPMKKTSLTSKRKLKSTKRSNPWRPIFRKAPSRTKMKSRPSSESTTMASASTSTASSITVHPSTNPTWSPFGSCS